MSRSAAARSFLTTIAAHAMIPPILSDSPVSFSVFYFSASANAHSDRRYQMFLDTARAADRLGFEAVWIPERHFHDFGGLYPNPSVLGAAVAMLTERIAIRAGSVVLPLQSPLRVVEEWAVVDNLSGGRVAVSCASGWHPDDFVLAPASFTHRRDVMFEQIDVLRRLWRGETIDLPGPDGSSVPTRIYPSPMQPELPLWITSASSAETWQRAAMTGANVLTTVQGGQLDGLAQNVAVYREQLRSTHGPSIRGIVTAALFTFVGDELDAVRERVHEPMCEYLSRHLTLYDSRALSREINVPVSTINEADRRTLLNIAFDRYFNGGSLIGTPRTCSEMVGRLRAIGVDEIACLIDFGVEPTHVLHSLELLQEIPLV